MRTTRLEECRCELDSTCDDLPLVAGGQGRTDEQVRLESEYLLWIFCASVVCVVVLTAAVIAISRS